MQNKENSTMIDITRNSLNGKFFYLMNKEELTECIALINERIATFNQSTAGRIEKERNAELWQAHQACIFCMNRL